MKFYLSSPSGKSFGFELDPEVILEIDEAKRIVTFRFPFINVIMKIRYLSVNNQSTGLSIDLENEISEEQIKFFRNHSYNFHTLLRKALA